MREKKIWAFSFKKSCKMVLHALFWNILQFILDSYTLHNATVFGVAPLCGAVSATLPPTERCCLSFLPLLHSSQWQDHTGHGAWLSLGDHFGLPPPGPETLPESGGRRARPPWCWLAARSSGQWAAVCEPWLQAARPLIPSPSLGHMKEAPVS